jgi:hypothetical protein
VKSAYKRSLIERLTALKLCPIDTAAALEAWPGVSQASDGWRWWRLGPRRSVRRLGHIKLIHRSRQPLQAKAYLYFELVEDVFN